MQIRAVTVSIPVVALAVLGAYACSGAAPASPTALPSMSNSSPLASVATAGESAAARSAQGGRAGSLGVVYVTGQGLYYDTFVSAQSLPNRGPFQLLEDGQTEFGPGDKDYLGGRWWIDENQNGMRDDDDTYLLCPLLPPGRTQP